MPDYTFTTATGQTFSISDDTMYELMQHIMKDYGVTIDTESESENTLVDISIIMDLLLFSKFMKQPLGAFGSTGFAQPVTPPQSAFAQPVTPTQQPGWGQQPSQQPGWGQQPNQQPNQQPGWGQQPSQQPSQHNNKGFGTGFGQSSTPRPEQFSAEPRLQSVFGMVYVPKNNLDNNDS